MAVTNTCGRHILACAQYHGYTALICAGYNGQTVCVRLLLDAGADTEAKDRVRVSAGAGGGVGGGGGDGLVSEAVCHLHVCLPILVFFTFCAPNRRDATKA